jgi:hypothetical protein
MSVYVCVPNFPEPGTPPDLTFYYNRSWLNAVTLADKSGNSLSNANIPITLNSTDNPLTQAIGYVLVPEAVGDKVLTDPFVIQFTQAAGSGSITFTDNQISADNTWGPNQTLTFQLTGGTGNYAFTQGFVTVKTDSNLGRFFYVYFFKSTTSIPDLRGSWDYSIKVLRLENPTDTLDFSRSYKFSDASGVTLSQDWDGDKRFVYLYIPPAGVLRPTPGYLPGILTFVNGQLQLELSDYDDNGVYTARITKRDSTGRIIEFTGLYTEGGFSSTNPDQKPTAGEWTLKRRT